MKRVFLYCFLLFTIIGFSQKPISKLLKKEAIYPITYLSVDSLSSIKNNVIILDSRELIEYQTSHIKHAIHVGYNLFNIKKILKKFKNKQSKIVVYCSIGIRSNHIAQKLKNAGYDNIYNLYGGIFEWKNKGFSIVNNKEQETEEVHTFNKKWSKWLKKGKKIY